MPFLDISPPCGRDHSVGQRAGKERLDKNSSHSHKGNTFPPRRPKMRTNHVLIDSENVQPEGLAQALHASECFRAHVFLGANQKNCKTDLAIALQPFGERVQYVRISGNGSNALDFHIAYYIGHLSAQDGNAFFHIISRDTGFDPLIDHLTKERGIDAKRSVAIAEIPLLKRLNSKSPKDRAEAVREKLANLKGGKPATVKKLDNVIKTTFPTQLTPEEITAVRDALVKTGHISITGTKVSYPLPGNATPPGQSSQPRAK